MQRSPRNNNGTTAFRGQLLRLNRGRGYESTLRSSRWEPHDEFVARVNAVQGTQNQQFMQGAVSLDQPRKPLTAINEVIDKTLPSQGPPKAERPKPKPLDDFVSLMSSVTITKCDPIPEAVPVSFSEDSMPEPNPVPLPTVDEPKKPVEDPKTPDINNFQPINFRKVLAEFKLKKRIHAKHVIIDAYVTCIWKTETYAILFVFNADSDQRLCFARKLESYQLGHFYHTELCVLFDAEMPHPFFRYATIEPCELSTTTQRLCIEDGDHVMNNPALQFHGAPMIPYRNGHFLHDECFGYVYVPNGEGVRLNNQRVVRPIKLSIMKSDTIIAYWAFVVEPEPEVVIEDAAIADYLFLGQKGETGWLQTK